MAEKPLRGDALYGLVIFETAKYNEALQMFQQAVGEFDELSQNAQLQLGQTYLKLIKQPAQMAFEAASRDNYNPQNVKLLCSIMPYYRNRNKSLSVNRLLI